MTLDEWREVMAGGAEIEDGEVRDLLCELTQEALRITAKLNGEYHTPEEIRELMCELTGRELDPTFVLSPPFYTDCGKNLRIGRNVFINSGCCFQDQGGIVIDDNALVGHNCMICTLNHNLEPEKRTNMFPSPVRIGKNVWIGANVTVLPGVEIGDNAVIGAGSVVTRDIPENALAYGVPARVVTRRKDEMNVSPSEP